MRSIENGGQESSQAADPVPEIPLHLLEDTSTHIQSKRLIMGIDFGTTFSAISYVALAPGEATDLVLSNRIQSIRNYPDDMNDNSTDPMKKEVPTEVIYPMVKGFRKKAKLELTTDEVINQHDRDMAGRASHVDIMDVDEEEDDYDPMDEGNPEEFQWGYGVHQTLKFRESYLNTQQMALTRFKLLLHEDPATEPVRERLRPTIDILRSRGIIKENVMIIADYLTYLLRHAKRELQIQNLYEGYQIEIVLCVPAIWSQQAGRDMQAALSTALLGADFKGVDVQNKSIMNLFVVSEPEAAATYVLEHERRIKVSILSCLNVLDI